MSIDIGISKKDRAALAKGLSRLLADSYTLYLKELDEGRSPNVAAPAVARHYWQLAEDATLRDVVLVVRADEAHHRDVNHGFASELAGLPVEDAKIAPYPAHADDIRMAA